MPFHEFSIKVTIAPLRDFASAVGAAGDGSADWPEEAPFDAIIVSAVAPHIADPLLQQLAPGGRLVIPVSRDDGEPRLLRVTRHGEERFEEEDLGGVKFVPLIGEEAFAPST